MNLFVTRAIRAKLLALSGSRLAGVAARAGHAALLPASVALLGRVHDHLGHRDGHARRIAQAARETVGPPRRCARLSLSRERRAEALSRRAEDRGELRARALERRDCACIASRKRWSACSTTCRCAGSRCCSSSRSFRSARASGRRRTGSAAKSRATILEDREARTTLTGDVFVPPPGEPGLGALEAALDKAVRAIPVETKLRDAVRAGELDRAPGYMLDDLGLAAGVISAGRVRSAQRRARRARRGDRGRCVRSGNLQDAALSRG